MNTQAFPCHFNIAGSIILLGVLIILVFFSESNKFRRIPVLGDGRCLFRCAAVYCHRNLQSCMRSRCGLPQSDTLAKFETEIATKLRTETVNLIAQHSN